jgi:uncharacterized protein YbaP (TraB family)
MNKVLAYLCLFSLFINQGCKRGTQKVFPIENSLLWEISGKGLRFPSYLFGTDHLLGKNFADSLSSINKYFSTCKVVVGEVIFDTVAARKVQPDMLSTYNPLNKVLKPTEFADVDKTLRQYTKFRLADLDNTKPMLIELLILNSIAPKTTSPSNPLLDKYFQEKAKAIDIKIIGLETLDFQTKLLFDTPIDIQKKNLLVFIKNIDIVHENLVALTRLYKQQNLTGIDSLTLKNEEYNPEDNDRMLKDRNLRWVEEIPKIINKQPTFIAIGCAHLIREYGLVNQLRLKGYTVKPVLN